MDPDASGMEFISILQGARVVMWDATAGFLNLQRRKFRADYFVVRLHGSPPFGSGFGL